MNNKRLLLVVSMMLLVLFTVSTTATVIYARSAESTAKGVAKDLEGLRITTQNKCIVRMVLSYPPPVPNDQFSVILTEYDACIAAQEKKIKEEENDIPD